MAAMKWGRWPKNRLGEAGGSSCSVAVVTSARSGREVVGVNVVVMNLTLPIRSRF
jgi:hypothetical protein